MLELDAAAAAAGLRDRARIQPPSAPCHPMGHQPVLALDDAAERTAADLTLDAAERTPPLELPAADDPKRHRPVLVLDAAALGQDAAELDAAALTLDAAELDAAARAAGRS